MKICVELTYSQIEPAQPDGAEGQVGAWVEFSGIVRGEEQGGSIKALEYEAYDSMAERVMQELLGQLGQKHGCTEAHVIHRLGAIPVGELAIWIGVASSHRKEAFTLAAEFMDQLKKDVPIWKCRAVAG